MSFEYIRDSKKPICVSTQVMRWLWFLAKIKECSVDELADSILRANLILEYPKLTEGQKKLDQLEKEIIESLKQ